MPSAYQNILKIIVNEIGDIKTIELDASWLEQ